MATRQAGAGLERRLEADEASQEAIDDIHEQAAQRAGVSPDTAFGRPGPPFHRRAPFVIGFTGALGAACAVAIAWAIVAAGQVLVLLALAFFIAVGLDPVVVWLYRRGLPRPLAVAVVLLLALAMFGGFLALAIPVVTKQATALSSEIPHYLHTLNRHN